MRGSLIDRTPSGRTVKNERVFRRWDTAVYVALTAVNFAAAAYALWWWFSRHDWSQQSVVFVLLSIPFIIGLGMFESRWVTLPLMSRPRHMPASGGWRVGVATTFVPGSEPHEMLEDTLTALVAMDYPHDTWVLDEGDDERVKALCERLGARHFSRKAMSQYQTDSGRFQRRSKHGNYNAWLQEVGFEEYDVIVAFDPDHVPHRRFLERVLGYFDDPEVGYVQAAQVYYNQPASFIAHGAAEETYNYYSTIQMSSYALGYPIVTGCHNAHRVAALRDVGGFAPHDADDLLITIYYRAARWRGVYVPETLALGITPVDWKGYLTQQRRWARSVLDVKFRIFPKVAKRLPRLERMISLAHGLYYLHGLGTALGLGILCYMLASGDTPTVFGLSAVPPFIALFLVLTVCNFYRQRFFLNARGEWGLHWRAGVLHFAKWPYVLLALRDAVFARYEPYAITQKVRTGSSNGMVAIPHLIGAASICAAWTVGMIRDVVDNPALHLAAGIFVAAALALAATELLRFAPPYNRGLAKGRLWPEEERGIAPPQEPPSIVGVAQGAARGAPAQRR
jgi:cellulose synthase (UDP-forming)